MTDEAMVELNKAAECHQCGGTGSIQTAYDGPPTFGFEPCPRCAGTDEAMVEELARIIDPSSWAVMDGYLKDMLRKYKGENAAYDPDAFKHKASMATARAVLASPTFTRLRNPPLTGDEAGLVDRLRSSAKAFRENTVYDSEGDPLRLIVQADEADEAADTITRLIAERDGAYERAAQVAVQVLSAPSAGPDQLGQMIDKVAQGTAGNIAAAIRNLKRRADDAKG